MDICESIQTELQKAVDAICEQHNLDKIRVDVKYAQQDDSSASQNSILESKLKELGISRMVNSKGEQILDYKSGRPKYPFVIAGPRGGRWKCTASELIRRFA